MPHDLPKAYDPTAIEDKWAEYWVREKLFTQPAPAADAKSAEGNRLDGQSQPFTILLPPPNVTGRLHMGHMLNQTEMDILTRWHRMKGDKTLWLPGTDHAGIATQMMVEKQLALEGTSRQQLGREAFEARVWQWKSLYGSAILDQMKRLGASVDWDREYFTMDANLSVAVREAFVRLHAQGLIYRGAYVVNWCPGCQTAVSDLEVVHEDVLGKLWEIRYPVAGSSAAGSLGEPGVPNDRSSSLGWLTIATTRPETMLGDVAVAIHPEDERYKHLHGKSLLLPLTNREIPIILDEWVSRDFGTGAVKITPAHDANDFAMGQRYNLPSINIMDNKARINENGGKYQGLDRTVARTLILADLEALGLLGTIHDHKLSIGRCDRSKDVIEPRLSTQWFVAVNKKPAADEPSMAELAVKAVTEGHIHFTPAMYEKTYLNWMENIHDWCISRQLWWGHRIPAWHCAACHKITVPASNQPDPTVCTYCGCAQIEQETDVLDTWFSSGLLPISVFGWPFLNQTANPDAPSFPRTSAERMGSEKSGPDNFAGAPGLDSQTGKSETLNQTPTPDFQTFYPTSLLVTGFDILFFWVARMIMLGCWFAKEVPETDGTQRTLARSVPFKAVYIHALVRDANREKMSKTKGNVLDPIGIVEKYGTDAVRFTLASMASPGTDIAFNEARTEGYRAFANKIWNAARFIFMNIDRAAENGIKVRPNSIADAIEPSEPSLVESQWILSQLEATTSRVNESLGRYRFDDAAGDIYQFFWGSFCDWYLEIVKLRLESDNEAPEALRVLLYTFESSLRLLSPFMPFLTEEIWHALYRGEPPTKTIALAAYPRYSGNLVKNYVVGDSTMQHLQLVVSAIRTRRKELGVEERALVPAKIACNDVSLSLLQKGSEIIQKLARIGDLELVPLEERNDNPRHSSLVWQAFGAFEIAIIFERNVDIPAERDRLTKEITKLEKNLTGSEKQLTNDAFLAKAPPDIVEGLKKQQSENTQLLAKAKAALAALPA